MPTEPVRSCRYCGCTEADCRGCIERTGRPCHWTGPDMCSACGPLAFINTTKRVLARSRHLAITDRRGVILCEVVPDDEGFYHHHAEAVRLAVEEGMRNAGRR